MMSTPSSPSNPLSYPQQQQSQHTPVLQQTQYNHHQLHHHHHHHHQQHPQLHHTSQQQVPLATSPPPIATVEVPIRQHSNRAIAGRGYATNGGRGPVVVRSDSGSSGGGGIVNATSGNNGQGRMMMGEPPASTTSAISSYVQSSTNGPTALLKHHLFHGGLSSSSADHKTQHSASTRSTVSGGGAGSDGNNLLQIAFPTAEFAIQQQLLLEQQQHNAQIYAEQIQLYQQQQHQQLPPLVVSVPAASTQLAPIISVPPALLLPPPSAGGSSPWTLGSTDGTFALSVLLREQQEEEATKQLLQQQQLNVIGDPLNSICSRETSSLSIEPAKLHTKLMERLIGIQQQQQHILPDVTPPSACGAAILADGHANVLRNDDVEVIDNGNNFYENNNEKINGIDSRSVDITKHQHNKGPDTLSDDVSAQQQQQITPSAVSATSYTERNPLLRMSGNTREEAITLLQNKQSLFQQQLFLQANVSSSVEACLAATCEVLQFDIAEMWLRTGPKTHQLTYSHLRPTALEDSARRDLVDVYYGEKSSERTHRLSPALCKRAKEAGDVVWVTAHNPTSAEALRCSISNVRTAVAVPVCHEASNTNMTILFFSIRRIIVRPTSVEFIVHMSLAAGVASFCSFSAIGEQKTLEKRNLSNSSGRNNAKDTIQPFVFRSEHGGGSRTGAIRPQPMDSLSITGARLDLQWRQLSNVEYLTDGGNSWIHTAVFQGRPVVVKTLKPECQDVAVAINEIEGELSIHSRLNHPNIVSLLGAGLTSKGVRFFVLERLDGGTLTQMLGYETRIRDRRRRFWRRKMFSFLDVLRIARSIAEAMAYCHEAAIPGSIVLHRDLKPDNIGFTLDGTVKLMDFGLAKILENASVDSDTVYSMSGETGSLRYMAPEVADGLPYNFTADVYSFGIILWELNAGKKPYEGLNRELFYERIVHGGERPSLSRKWPADLTSLMTECWDADMFHRPPFREIVSRLDSILAKEKGVIGIASVKLPSPGGGTASSNGADGKAKKFFPKLTGMIDRHSMWF